MREQMHEFLNQMIDSHVICGASWAFVSEEGFSLYCCGRRGAVEPYSREALMPGMYYDLASLSKVVGTASRILQLAQEKKLCMDTPVWRILEEFRYPEVTVANLLLHNSGLMAEVIEKERLTKETIVRRVYETPQLFLCGETCLYSDVGFILLGMIIQKLDDVTLEESLREHVFRPLGMYHTSYMTDPEHRSYVPTECTEKRGCICGEVHDSKAYLLEQSGSAGLFSTLDDLAVFAWHYLNRSGKLLGAETFELVERTECFGRTYGWSKEYGGRTLYHTGFTGTSMLLDMEKKRGWLLLTNRIHPSRSQVEFLEWRKKLNRLFLEGH